MARVRAILLITAVFGFGLTLSVPAATGDPDRGEEPIAATDDSDDDDDDDGEGSGLERRPIAGLGPPRLLYVPGELLVRFRAGTSSAEKEGAAARAGGEVVGDIPELGVHVVRVPPARTEAALESLRSEPSVESVERDVLMEGLDTVPNDALWPAQWGLRVVGAPRAWDATRGEASIVVAVLDTGIAASHPDLAGAVIAGRDLVNDDPDPADDEGHGTAAAGVVAARTNNGEGQAGVCWACSLMPVKVLDSTGTGKTSTIAAGIVWAVDHGARVLNMSFGSPGTTSALQGAVTYASQRNTVMIAAAGNSNADTPFYPAAYGDVISVAATTEADALYSWSNYGGWVTVAAPGCNPAPRLGGGYVEFCGTSSAAPLVAGMAGLALSLKPAASNREVEEAIARSVVPVSGVAAFGRLNAPEVMNAVSPTGSAVPLQPPAAPPASPPAAPPPPAATPSGTTAPRNLKRPRLLGRARVGRTLRVVPGIWSPAPQRFAYQWRRCRRNGAACRTIRGARGRTYRLKLRDRGRRLRAVVVAVNAGGTVRAVTGASAVVRGRPSR